MRFSILSSRIHFAATGGDISWYQLVLVATQFMISLFAVIRSLGKIEVFFVHTFYTASHKLIFM